MSAPIDRRPSQLNSFRLLHDRNASNFMPNATPSRTATSSQIPAHNLLHDLPPNYNDVIVDLQPALRTTDTHLPSPRFDQTDKEHAPPKFETLHI